MLKHRLTSVFFLTGPNRCFFASSQFVCYKTLLFTFLKWRKFPLQCETVKVRYQLHRQIFERNNFISYDRFSFSVYLNTEIELNFTPSNWHFFSPVSKGYLCWVCYDANKQLKSGYKFKGGKCSVCVSSTKP